MEIESCPICNSSKIKTSVSSVDNVWKEKCEVSYCYNCEAYFLEKKPSLTEVEGFNKTSYSRAAFLNSLIKSIFRKFRCVSQYHYIRESIPEVINNYHILEIGGGDARLLSCFRHNNLVTAVEHSDTYKKFAKRKYGIELINSDIFGLTDRFNLILMSHVFEHFLDLGNILTKIREILVDDGYLFMEIPNSPIYNNCDETEL